MTQRLAQVLVVDDDDDVRLATRRFLARANYEVDVAESGEEALETLRQGKRFDVIVMDLRMPGLQGVDLIHAIGEIDPHLSIIVCTGALNPRDEKALSKQGVFCCLEKPIDSPILLEAVQGAAIESAKWKVA